MITSVQNNFISRPGANNNDCSSHHSGSEAEPIKIKVIDLNVAFEVTPENPRIRFGTGLKEWSAPETTRQTYHDFKIDSWTLGCVMYFISVGDPPFEPDTPIEIDESFNLWLKLQRYQDSPTFCEMVDFISKLMVVDPENRMTSLEALRHPWLNAQPYIEENTLRRLQMKVMTEEELAEAKIDETSSINELVEPRAKAATQKLSKSPVLGPSKDLNTGAMDAHESLKK